MSLAPEALPSSGKLCCPSKTWLRHAIAWRGTRISAAVGLLCDLSAIILSKQTSTVRQLRRARSRHIHSIECCDLIRHCPGLRSAYMISMWCAHKLNKRAGAVYA